MQKRVNLLTPFSWCMTCLLDTSIMITQNKASKDEYFVKMILYKGVKEIYTAILKKLIKNYPKHVFCYCEGKNTRKYLGKTEQIDA